MRMLNAYPVDDNEMDEDFEAKDAMMSLFHAEEIKDKDDDFLSRISDQIDRKMDLLERVRLQLPTLPGIISIEVSDGNPKNGTRTFEDFLDRMRHKEDEEEMKTFESPKARRLRTGKS